MQLLPYLALAQPEEQPARDLVLLEGLAQLLLDAEAPVVIRGAMPGWQTGSYPQLLAAHAETPVEVITSGGTCMRRSRHAYRLEYTHALLL